MLSEALCILTSWFLCLMSKNSVFRGVQRNKISSHPRRDLLCALSSAIEIAFTCSMSVGQKDAGNRHRNAEVDRPPWICIKRGVRAALV